MNHDFWRGVFATMIYSAVLAYASLISYRMGFDYGKRSAVQSDSKETGGWRHGQ